MEFLTFLLKSLFILAVVVVMAAPIALEFYTFRSDEKKTKTSSRLRILIYTFAYVIVITVALYFLKELLIWLEGLSFVQWFANNIAIDGRVEYFCKVFVAILVNFAIGILYRFFGRFARIGLKKKNLLKPKSKEGDFTRAQKIERKIVRFFCKETWFFAENILKSLSIVLSAAYGILFILYQIPAVFGADWIPYDFISMIFSAGYIYPTITLIALWEIVFFLEGVKLTEEKCPELLQNDEIALKKKETDLNATEMEIRKQFNNYYVCDVDLAGKTKEETSSSNHNDITKQISQSVENDPRNPKKAKEIYMNCLDKIIESENSIIVNGSFFSEFSMYFLRYLSIIIARGDNVVFVCNNDLEIDEVYNCLKEGFSAIFSLYHKGVKVNDIDFDDPVWKIVKIKGDEEASVDEKSILVTSLSYICSTRFENKHSNFIHLIDTIVFVDVLGTINTYNRQLAMLNTRLKNITKNNALLSKNGNVNKDFRVRYMSKQVRYICFDDTRIPGIDKVLKNMLSVDFDSIDAMNYNANTIVRCYNFEDKVGETGRRGYTQSIRSEEKISVIMNMALLYQQRNIKVNVFTDDSIPYADIEESIAANMNQLVTKVDKNGLLLNSHCYNPDAYSVIIALDSGNNLPAALRRYISIASDKPTLVIVFSKPHMMRDYCQSNIDNLWIQDQMELIPVENGTDKEIAQRILVKANAGGISEEEILKICSGSSRFKDEIKAKNVNAILKKVLEIYDFSTEERMDLFKYFEYSSFRDFDENGNYVSEDKVLLRHQGKLFDIINGRDMVVMFAKEEEKTILPLPKDRLTQNYIARQNLLYDGKIYYIDKIDAEKGFIYTHLATGGRLDDVYMYIQSREYRIEVEQSKVENICPTKHVSLGRKEGEVVVNDIYLTAFKAPMEVVTNGYFKVSPYTLAVNSNDDEYEIINDPGNDELAKQTYRRYGNFSNPTYNSVFNLSSGEPMNLKIHTNCATMLSVKLSGQFGKDVDKTASLAAVMLNELIKSIFPSVADSVAVCAVLHSDMTGDEAKTVLKKQPKIKLIGQRDSVSSTDFELFIIEDSPTDLGVVSVLMSAGDDTLKNLFKPVFRYLSWYESSGKKSNYLYFGLDHEPDCFDFGSLGKLSKILGDDGHDLHFIDIDSLVEHETCDFCRKRYVKGDEISELPDGRKICKSCSENIASNNRKELKSYLERAKLFLENTYGITLDDEYKFCYDSTVKIVNALKQNRDLVTRGSDSPVKSYIDDKKHVHVECDIPSVNFSELLVRELTHVWQLKHLPDIDESFAEGHIALVSIQYLRFLNQETLANIRSTYYESTENISGEGYRKLLRGLFENPQFNNNPFRYLLEMSGAKVEDNIDIPTPRIIADGELGERYTPEKFDRALNGNISYFWRERLTQTKRDAYDELLAAVKDHDESVILEGCTFDDIENIMAAVSFDHPELFWFKSQVEVIGSTVKLCYGASVEEVELLKKRIDEVVPKYLEGIDDTMSAYDVALRLHAKVISSVDYDTIALNKEKRNGGTDAEKIDPLRTIYGVFIDGKAVCEGYARAMQYLLQKCGIECAEVAGHTYQENGEKGTAHAWNILKIDGDYYYLDTTWDDSSDTVQMVRTNDVGFNYFCITTNELMRTRDTDLCPADVPNCTATRGNYFYHNGFVVDSYDLNKLKAIAQSAAKNNIKLFSFKCTSKSLYDRYLSELCDAGKDCYEIIKSASKFDKNINVNAYSYSYNGKMWTITIRFKHKK